MPFSPLLDERVPDADGLLIGGGYPEAHAAALSANHAMRESVADFCRSGRPVIAECGGLMYLSHALETQDGTYPMCGVVPERTRMAGRLTLGYREVTSLHDTPLAPAGTPLRAHEFHYSVLDGTPAHPAYHVQGVPEGYARGNVLASYLHLHLSADPALPARLVHACLDARP